MPKNPRKFYGAISPILLLFIAFPFFAANLKPHPNLTIKAPEVVTAPDSSTNPMHEKMTMYEGLNLNAYGLSKKAFQYALKGYDYLLEQGKLTNANILTIVDFSKPSTEKRMYVIDMENLKVLYQTYVAHGRNSGKLYANKFSNVPESNMSSLGFYVTGDTYIGQHGYSLKLNGEEKGINDNAYKRAIVMHSADYASKGFINNQGYLGRSFGCPALPKELSKPIIETIKDGSCMFVYAPSKTYETKSNLL